MNQAVLFSLFIASIFISTSCSQDLQKLKLQQYYSSEEKNLKNTRNLDVFDGNITVHIFCPLGYAIQLDSTRFMYPVISSHYTGLSDGNCSEFGKFDCQSPTCIEDTSVWSSEDSGALTFTRATQLNITGSSLSIAGGAWKLKNSPLFLHDCNSSSYADKNEGIGGWVGLGLGAGANENYQSPNPIFSIMLNTSSATGELIFGYNPNYTDPSIQPIILVSDPDWKLQVTHSFFGNSSFVHNPITLIFNLRSSLMFLSASSYQGLKNLFLNNSNFTNCYDNKNQFTCYFFGNLTDLPPLTFILQDNTQFLVAPQDYVFDSNIDNPDQKLHTIQFGLIDSSTPGIDYIILPNRIFYNHYVVFQQHPNKTNTINLYSYAPELFDNMTSSTAASVSNGSDALPFQNIPSNSNNSFGELNSEQDNFDKSLILPLYDNENVKTEAGDKLTIIISSHDTGFSDGTCPVFTKYDCLSPSCIEDTSSFVSTNSSTFTSATASRLNLTENLSLTNGIWGLKDSPLYIHNCSDFIHPTRLAQGQGWIGLGLGAGANRNYRTSNPVFSFYINSTLDQSKLIFGYNPNYSDNSIQPIVLVSDPDWKLNSTNFSLGNLSISNGSFALIFSLRNYHTALPATFYHKLKDYFFNHPDLEGCIDFGDGFTCHDFNNSSRFPPLIFTLQDGTQLSIPPEIYMSTRDFGYHGGIAEFRLINSSATEVNYIAFGIQIMEHYYTVFQQLPNGTQTISLYFYAPELRAPSIRPISDEADSSSYTNSSAPDEINSNNTTQSDANKESINNATVNSSSEANSSINSPVMPAEDPASKNTEETIDLGATDVEENNEPSNTFLFVVIGIVLICVILLCLRRVLIRNNYLKKDSRLVSEFYKDEMRTENFEVNNEDNVEDI